MVPRKDTSRSLVSTVRQFSLSHLNRLAVIPASWSCTVISLERRDSLIELLWQTTQSQLRSCIIPGIGLHPEAVKASSSTIRRWKFSSSDFRGLISRLLAGEIPEGLRISCRGHLCPSSAISEWPTTAGRDQYILIQHVRSPDGTLQLYLIELSADTAVSSTRERRRRRKYYEDLGGVPGARDPCNDSMT